jgi:hypothetical protein
MSANSHHHDENDTRATTADIRRIHALVEAHGERATCEKLGIPRLTLARILGSLTVRRGSLALLRAGLERHAPRDAGHSARSGAGASGGPGAAERRGSGRTDPAGDPIGADQERRRRGPHPDVDRP